MAVTCALSAAAYLGLYEVLLDDANRRDAAQQRLEALDGSFGLRELHEAYLRYWTALTNRDSIVRDPRGAGEPLDRIHGELASWLLAPLRVRGASTEVSNLARRKAFEHLAAAGCPEEVVAASRIGVICWTVGQVYGTLDFASPLVPAAEITDPDLRVAYDGLVEHSAVFSLGGWTEMAGSAVYWRIGGLAEALRPQSPDARLRGSLEAIHTDIRLTLPPAVTGQLASSALADFIETRNAFTHVKAHGHRSLSDVHHLAQDRDSLVQLLQLATHLVCGVMSYDAFVDDNYLHWGKVLERVVADLSVYDMFVEDLLDA